MIKCKECDFYREVGCHRHAPRPETMANVEIAQDMLHVMWPVTEENDGCGEGVLRSDILTERMLELNKRLDDLKNKVESKTKDLEYMRKKIQVDEILKEDTE